MFVKKEKTKEVRERCKTVAFILISLLVACIIPNPVFATVKSDENTFCNCVVFRMSSIQDNWINDTQILLMDTFIDRGLNLTLGLQMHNIGNDSSITNKISEGYKKGLFELGLHGWDHVNYTKLSEDEQRISLLMANEKMQKLFGNKSDVFIPPYNEFNGDTVKAMTEVRLKVLSSSLYEEYSFNQGKSIFIAKTRANENNYTSFSNVINTNAHKIYHLPTTSELERYQNNTWIKMSVDKILEDIFESIDSYGYAVISVQPQSFLKVDKVGRPNFTKPEIDVQNLHDLSFIIDTLLNKKVKIASYYNIVNKVE